MRGAVERESRRARTEVELIAKPSMARRPRSLSPMVSSELGSLSEWPRQLAALGAMSVKERRTANAASESADDSVASPLPPLVPWRSPLDSVDTPGDPAPWLLKASPALLPDSVG